MMELLIFSRNEAPCINSIYPDLLYCPTAAVSTYCTFFFTLILVLENLSRGYLSHNEKPNHWPIFHSERHQMINLDIPMFEHNIGSSEFTTSLSTTANLHFPDAHNSVRNRLLNLDSTSISFQLLLIRGSFEAASLHIPEYLMFPLSQSLPFLHSR